MDLNRDDLLRILRDDKWPSERRVEAGRAILRRGNGESDTERRAYAYAAFICDAADIRELAEAIFRNDLALSAERLAAMSDEDLRSVLEIFRRLLTRR